MIASINMLTGAAVNAVDGEVGTLEDFMINDQNWAVGYLVVMSGDWTDRRKLLFPPATVKEAENKVKVFNLGVDRSTVEQSPNFDLKASLTRQQEIELHQHYGLPIFSDSKLGPETQPLAELLSDMREHGVEIPGDEIHSRLFSFEDMKKFSVEARDGSLGSIEDLLVDLSTWKVQYMVLSTGSLLNNRQVLSAPGWIEKIDRDARTIQVDLAKETIENSPEYQPENLQDPDYQGRIEDFFRQDE
jgi:uncharacterized protein YrrD